jgi:ABC-type antimicrobial peptide transport system permease subunit
VISTLIDCLRNSTDEEVGRLSLQPYGTLRRRSSKNRETGVLVTGPNGEVRIPRSEIKSMQPSKEIWAVDRNVALTLTGSLEDFMRQFTYAEPRFGLVLMSVFAGVGLLLVALGVFSVIAYTVSRQTHEIGIRMALGAGRPDVLRMVLTMGGQLLGAGVALGLLGAFAATRVIANQLWGVSPRDPVTLAAVIAVVAAAGLAACWFPARRATRVDPLVALRYE